MSNTHDLTRSVTELGDDRAEWEEVLREGIMTPKECPEYSTYCDLFYAYFKKSPYHIRRGYEQGFIAKTAKYKNGSGSYYPACFPALLERHLDPDPDRPFWLALRFGQKSCVKCIDFDNKDNVLGYFHDRGQYRPVAHVPVAHLIKMKRLYYAFPGHVWCVSSATLGLHVWEMFRSPRDPATVERLTRPRLNDILLGGIEVYPSPALANQVLRRPFGLDYYTVSDSGLITDWAAQTTYFATARSAPPFRRIVTCLLDLAKQGWDRCVQSGGFRAGRATEFAKGKRLHRGRLDEEAAEVLAWLDAGCPDDHQSVTNMAPAVVNSCPVDVRASHNPTVSEGSQSEPPTRPVPITASVVRRRLSIAVQKKWSWRKVVELARGGVPDENRLFEHLLLLARPLVWRDHFNLDVVERLRQVEADLLRWVETKHNGLVTRVHDGRWADIEHEIRRQVRVAHEATSASLQRFYSMMQARDAAHPGKVQRLTDIIRGTETSLPPPVCCMRINKEPDDTPLPPVVHTTVLGVVRDKKMRRRAGDYPLLRFARRFLNRLWGESGVAQISRDTLFELCDSRNPNQLLGYKMILARCGFISDQWLAHVRPGVAAAVYEMTSQTFDEFQAHHGTARTKALLPPTSLITSRAAEKLEAVDWSWV